jgi:hypothetical protein
VADVVGRRVRADVGDDVRVGTERRETPSLVGLRLWVVDFEPPGPGAAEADCPAVVARAEEDDLSDVAPDGARDFRVDETRARLESPAGSEGNGDNAAHVAVEG